MTIQDLFSKLKAQGFYGHAGRPGKRGGSVPKGVGLVASSSISNDDLENVISKGTPETIQKAIEKKIPYKAMVKDFYDKGTDSKYFPGVKGLHNNPTEFREIANSRSKADIERSLTNDINTALISRDLKRMDRDSRFWHPLNDLIAQ